VINSYYTPLGGKFLQGLLSNRGANRGCFALAQAVENRPDFPSFSGRWAWRGIAFLGCGFSAPGNRLSFPPEGLDRASRESLDPARAFTLAACEQGPRDMCTMVAETLPGAATEVLSETLDFPDEILRSRDSLADGKDGAL